ncbi:MAG: hypothetical protein PHY43_04985 [Verrucomicrobiales bacterium]|nr:hypothetical protein [Verrucomicrobiales bacterium]
MDFHVKRAIDFVYARDSKLFSVDASEWAIAHRLAVYLEQKMPEWNVDCEYNRQRHGPDPKTGEYDEKVRPDMTIHHRGEAAVEHNLLVVELKKREEESDWKKLCEYTSEPNGKRTFQYQYELALSFFPSLEMRWFENGQEKQLEG